MVPFSKKLRVVYYDVPSFSHTIVYFMLNMVVIWA